MRQERRAVNGFYFFGCIGHHIDGVTFFTARIVARRSEAFTHMVGNHGTVDFGVGAFVPNDGQLSQCIFSSPPSIGHHGHSRCIDSDHRLHPTQSFHFAVVKADQLASKHRAVHDRSAQHAVQLQINAVDEFAIELVGSVQTFDRFAGNFPRTGVLQNNRFHVGHRQLGSGSGHLAIACFTA